MKMAFITRHAPTPSQSDLAKRAGYELIPVGDRDAFTADLADLAEFNAVACVHPALALRLARIVPIVGVFENANRAPEGEKPRFEALALHLYIGAE